ncbi:hypothetical protein AYO44_00260 [Planctomycetaceae bacterium SCGC AG-212-F19]|nr:hypothetical protein AYO44_00260 [Planctomycetaceae bacterium SCGC AG-212-F19]
MAIQWEPFVDLVRRSTSVVLTTHVRPDGDGLGSMRALAEALETLGKRVRMTVASVLPPRYQFLIDDGRVERFELPGEPLRDADLAIVLDTGTRNQLGDFAAFLDGLTVPKVVIDHHPTQDGIATLPLVDTSAEATGRLAYDAIKAVGVPVSPRMANALFTALAMDTGWFRFSNTTPATYALAGELVAAGATPEHLYELLFEQNSLGRVKLMGLALDRLKLECDGRVAYTEIRRSDYAGTGAVPSDTEDLVNFTRTVAGVEVGLFFMEQPRGGVKVSFRSRTHNVGQIAEQFGGGGHRLASGAILEATLAEAERRVLEAVRLALPARAVVQK